MLINNFCKSFLQASQVSLTGLLLSIGFATASSMPIFASAVEAPAASSTSMATAKVPASATNTAPAKKQMANGVYLFGQSSKAQQLGQEYVIFEARRGKVVGAFYMPSSEFSCFHGTLNGSQMDLTVLDTYEQTTYSHSIALQGNSLVASNNQIALQGYQPVRTITANDRRMLSACRSSH